MKTCQDVPEEDSTMDLFNEYLKVLKRKLLLTIQVLTSLVQSDGESRHQQHFTTYDQCKADQSKILLKLHKAKIVTVADRRTFDRFCLRIYEQYESTTQKITKGRLTSVQPSELVVLLQGIFGEFKSTEQEVNVGQFLFKIVDLQENFKLRSLRKIFNQIRKNDVVIADSCKSLFKQQLALKLKYDSEYESWSNKCETNLIQAELETRHSLAASTPTSEQRNLFSTITVLSDSNSFLKKREVGSYKIHTKIFIKPPTRYLIETKICDHCQFLKLLDLANIDEYAHNTRKNQQIIMELLRTLNQKNVKLVDQWRRATRRAAKLPVPANPVFREYPVVDEQNRTYKAKPTLERKRVSGTRSVIMSKESKHLDDKKGNSLKKMSDKIRRPSLAKLTEKKHDLEMLRDMDNQKDKIFYSFNGEQVFQKSREFELNDSMKKQYVGLREQVALPRITRR